jgi:ATP-dependent Clp protease ATP-binding subunit ClpA
MYSILLLQVLDEGRLTDSLGRKVDETIHRNYMTSILVSPKDFGSGS